MRAMIRELRVLWREASGAERLGLVWFALVLLAVLVQAALTAVVALVAVRLG